MVRIRVRVRSITVGHDKYSVVQCRGVISA